MVVYVLGVVLATFVAHAGVVRAHHVPANRSDVRIHATPDTVQSEVSVAVDPTNPKRVLVASNVRLPANCPGGDLSGCLFRLGAFVTENGGLSWTGSNYATAGVAVDPAVGIDLEGRLYAGGLTPNTGTAVARSLDGGFSWSSFLADSQPIRLDKTHLAVDNQPLSPFAGNVYLGWSLATDVPTVARSEDQGQTWIAHRAISPDGPGSKLGINLAVGPQGQLYAVWRDRQCPGSALGFARSLPDTPGEQPGDVWDPDIHIPMVNVAFVGCDDPNPHPILNIRVNSYPSMAVDRFTGRIYVVWINEGTPGPAGGGNEFDVYLVYSDDEGDTWADPVRVNSDDGFAYQIHPWVATDPAVANQVWVSFYDARTNTEPVANPDDRAWHYYVAHSAAGGVAGSFTDFPVSDAVFRYIGNPEHQARYEGSYAGIAVRNQHVYPVWYQQTFAAPPAGHATMQLYVSPILPRATRRPPERLTPSVEQRAAQPPGRGRAQARGPRLDATRDESDPSTYSMRYSVPAAAPVRLVVHNVRGQRVATVVDDTHHPAGTFVRTWSASGLPAGVYHCRLHVGTQAATRRLVVLGR